MSDLFDSTGCAEQDTCEAYALHCCCWVLTCMLDDAQDKVPQNVADEISSAIASTREVAQSSEDPEAIRAKVPKHMDLSVACCTWLSITVWPSP